MTVDLFPAINFFSFWKKHVAFRVVDMNKCQSQTTPVSLVFCTLVQDQNASPHPTHPIPVEAEPKTVQLFPHGLDVAEGGDRDDASQKQESKRRGGDREEEAELYLPPGPVLWVQASLDSCILCRQPKSIPTHRVHHLKLGVRGHIQVQSGM